LTVKAARFVPTGNPPFSLGRAFFVSPREKPAEERRRRSVKKLILALSAATLALPAAPAMARHHSNHNHYRTVERVRVYDSRGRYVHPHRLTRNSHVWRGRDGHYYCRRDNGTTGLVIGAAAGGLLGNELARDSRDRTLATIIGAVGGGLLGQSVDRGDLQCR
jgi:uncharacterized protein YcfJ